MSEPAALYALYAVGVIIGLLIIVVGLILALRHPHSGATEIAVRKDEIKVTTGHVGVALVSLGILLVVVAGAFLYFHARRSEYQAARLREATAALSRELVKRGEGVTASGFLTREKARGDMPSRWLLQLDSPLNVGGQEFKTLELPPGDRRLLRFEGQRVGVEGVPVQLKSPDGRSTATIIPERVMKHE